MKIAILGFGYEGKRAYDYWKKPENSITICDSSQDVEVPFGAEAKLGVDYLKDLDQFDLIVRSPGVHPRDIVTNNSWEIMGKVTSVLNEFFRVSPTKNIIGVTGTKGKGTTSTLIAKMLEAASKKVFLGGNIGVVPLEFLPGLDENSWVVLELSSFQLMDIKSSPHIGVCLMIAGEHLNWHGDMREYVEAKSQLFAHQKSSDIAIYFPLNELSERVAMAGAGKKIPYFRPLGAEVIDDVIIISGHEICKVAEVKLLGKHNLQNICAAVTAVWQVTQNVEAIKSAVTSFTGLPHRLEFVREVDGVKYYDDSFGTTPETAIAAIEAFKEPEVVILGGSDKGVPYDELAKTVQKSNIRLAILIGDTAAKIQAALEKADFKDIVTGKTTMPEVIEVAQAAAQPGDVVLLSTACASFGLFKNYKDRGQQFQQAVRALS